MWLTTWVIWKFARLMLCVCVHVYFCVCALFVYLFQMAASVTLLLCSFLLEETRVLWLLVMGLAYIPHLTKWQPALRERRILQERQVRQYLEISIVTDYTWLNYSCHFHSLILQKCTLFTLILLSTQWRFWWITAISWHHSVFICVESYAAKVNGELHCYWYNCLSKTGHAVSLFQTKTF